MSFNLCKLLPSVSAFGVAMSTLLVATTAGATQTEYPTRPITMVVGYAPGGATDILARVIAKSLAAELKQTVIVENKAGANSNIGADYVAKSKNDGYTLYVGTIANTINRALYKDLRYDFLTDFEPIGMMASIANVLVVNPKTPYKSVEEYLAYAKENPGKLTCASSGIGSSIHMSCELFKLRTGTDIMHVPYRGSGPAVADLLGGQVDSMFDNLPSSMSHIQAGNLRPIATTTSNRLDSLPDTPTFLEEGINDFVVQSWFGLDAPAGTDAPIIAKLNTALNNALQSPEVIAIYKQNGFVAPAAPNSPESFKRYTEAEIAQWAKVVEQGDIQVN